MAKYRPNISRLYPQRQVPRPTQQSLAQQQWRKTVRNGRKNFYVRPSGGSYGREDGLDYDNAWDGFSNIDWSLVANNTLIVAGTHNETLTVGASNVVIRGDYVGDAGVVDVQSLQNTSIDITDADHITLKNISAKNALVSCVNVFGNVTVFRCEGLIADGSGNQTVQQDTLTDLSSTFIDCQFLNGTDDGVSSHVAGVLNFYNCLFENNGSGYDRLTGRIIEANFYDCTFKDNTTHIEAAIEVTATCNNCIFSNGSLGATNITYNNCLITNCVTQYSTAATAASQVFEKCYFNGTTEFNLLGGNMTVKRSLFEIGTTASTFIFRITNSSNFFIENTVIYSTGSNTAISLTSTGSTTFNNITFVSNGNLGFGLRSSVDVSVNNCIFTLWSRAMQSDAGTITDDSCNVFSNTFGRRVVGGAFSTTNDIVGDPVLVDVGNLDFNLGVGSVCIGTGATLTDSTTIDSANWGNGTTETPTVTTDEQGVSWNVGAYV